MEGWIKAHRSLLDHWLWDDKPFSKGQAWIDILMLANHADKKTVLGNDLVNIERGSFITSELKLADRWGWSKTKVRAFLSILESDNMIVKKSDRKKTTVTIVNYGLYQESQTTERPKKNHEETTKELQKNTNKNEKNDKNEKNINNKSSFVPSDFDLMCVEKLIQSCRDTLKSAKVPETEEEKKKWAIEIDRMKRLDGREEEQILKALEYATTNSFWKSNIRSTKKFRDKFEVLYTQSQREPIEKKSVVRNNNNFERRKYDMDRLEEQLLER